jgi:predicted transcriptional regulator
MTTTRKRRSRADQPAARVWARVDEDVKKRLVHIADTTGLSESFVLERILREMPLDVHGLPEGWAAEFLTAEQGELPVDDE